MSGSDVNPVGLPRGQSSASAGYANFLGRTFDFTDMTDSSPTGTIRSQRKVKMMLVKNGESSAAITPGMLCTWKTLLSGKTVVKPAASSAAVVHGVADHHLPAAGAAAGEYFWMVVDGPCQFINDANAGVTEFDQLVVSPSVAGSVRLQDAAPATGTLAMLQVNSRVGQCEVTALASAMFYGCFNTVGASK